VTVSKQDLIDGLQLVLREGLRVTSEFGPDDWKKPALGGDGDGWTRREVYGHLTVLAEVTPGLVGNLANLQPGQDAMAGLDLDTFNAQTVATKAGLSEAELMAAYKTGFENLIAFVKSMPDDQLIREAKFGELQGKVADVMDGVLVLHGVAHVYGAGGSPLG
jgi:hypothetical protein